MRSIISLDAWSCIPSANPPHFFCAVAPVFGVVYKRGWHSAAFKSRPVRRLIGLQEILAQALFLHALQPPSIRGPVAEAVYEFSDRRFGRQAARTRARSLPFPDRMP